MAIGPSGWTRTTTTRAKSPACCVDTTEGMELIPGVEPGRRPYQSRRLPLHQISGGANGGIRTRTSRLGRPAGNRYPRFALVRPELTPRPNTDRCRSPVHRRASVVKDPALASWWAARDSNPSAPWGRTGLRPVSGPSARTARVWRQRQDSNLDPRALEARMLPLHHAADVTSRRDRFRKQNLPMTALSCGREAKTKKAF